MNFIVNKGFILFLILGFFACSTPEKDAASRDQKAKADSSKVVIKNNTEDSNGSSTMNEALQNFEDEMDFATFIAVSIEEQDYSQWNQVTGDEILFSPYAYIDEKTANSLSVDALNNPTNKEQFWGFYDGRGDSILLSTEDYLNRFVYAIKLTGDSVQVTIHTDEPESRGSEIQNAHKIYPSSTYVEFYNPASTKNGMDWEALIFVVSKHEDSYILEAIIHNQWTV